MDHHVDTVGEEEGSEDDTLDTSLLLAEQDDSFSTMDGGNGKPGHINGSGMEPNGGNVGRSLPDESVEQQLIMIEEMVHEMKQGFVIAMEELTKIQEGDGQLQQKMQNHKESVDSIISSFTEHQVKQKSELISEIRLAISKDQEQHQHAVREMITAVKNEVNTVSGRLREVLDYQRHLQNKVVSLQTDQHILLEELVKSGAVSENVRNILQKNSPDSGLSEQSGQHSTKSLKDDLRVMPSMEDEVTASACRFLSLLQALEEQCTLPDLSDSSDEDLHTRGDQWTQNSDDNTQPQNLSEESYPEYQAVDSAERQQSVRDVVDSEREYCSKLCSLLDGYLTPLQEGLYVSTRELNILFPPYLSQLFEEHCHILNVLEDRLQHWTWGGLVGDVFARMTDSQTGNLISLYKEYLADFKPAVDCLRRQITQSRKFRAFMKSEDRPNSGDIISLLTAPIKQIPQYTLLLQHLLKHTPGSHPDHYALDSTLARLRSFVDQFSEEIANIVSHDKESIRTSGLSFRSSPSGSSCDTGHPVSARDSGIHSNGEDHHPQHAYGRHFTPDVVETANNFRDPRTVLTHSRLAAHSQPDLTFGRYSTGQLLRPQGDRSYQDGYGLGASPLIHDKMSHHKKYKLRKKGDRQGVPPRPGSSLSHTSLPADHYSYQARHRPSSAIDFMSRHNPTSVKQLPDYQTRPKSAMSMQGVSNRVRPPHRQIISRHDGVMNRSLPGSVTNSQSSVHHPVQGQLNHSFPIPRSCSPYSQDSPRIVVNGQTKSYPDSFHGINTDYGVYSDEEQTLNSAHSMKHRSEAHRLLVKGYSEDIDLAVSLADSLNAAPDIQDSIPKHMSLNQTGRESCLTIETESSHNKSDQSMHASDLQQNSVDNSHSEDVEDTFGHKPAPEHQDSSDHPNSSFDESVRSESRNSDQKPEGSSDIPTSQTESPLHSSKTETASVFTLSNTIPKPELSHDGVSTAYVKLRNPQLDHESVQNSSTLSDSKAYGISFGMDRSDTGSKRTRKPNRLSSPFPQRVPDIDRAVSPNEMVSWKKDGKKKKEKTKRYNSLENLPKVADDSSSKKTFKSSLKHFFGKKNGLLPNLPHIRAKQASDPSQGGSVRMDKLEAKYAKEHGLDHIPASSTDKGANSLNNNNNESKLHLKLDKEDASASTA